MKRYLDQVRRRVDELKAKVIQIPRMENKQADCLAKTTSVEHMTTLDNILFFVQFSPLIDFVDVQEIGSESNWTTPLVSYLKNGVLPNGRECCKKIEGLSSVIHLDEGCLI